MVTYKNGDLLSSGCKVICHQVNCQGVMGSGIAKEIRNRFPIAYDTFRKSFINGEAKLGNIDIAFDHDEYNQRSGCWLFICNMYAQFHYLPRGIVHTDYNALRSCIDKLKKEIERRWKDRDDLVIGFPYGIGCGLGGGDWNIVKNIIEEEFADDKWKVEIWKLN